MPLNLFNRRAFRSIYPIITAEYLLSEKERASGESPGDAVRLYGRISPPQSVEYSPSLLLTPTRFCLENVVFPPQPRGSLMI